MFSESGHDFDMRSAGLAYCWSSLPSPPILSFAFEIVKSLGQPVELVAGPHVDLFLQRNVLWGDLGGT